MTMTRREPGRTLTHAEARAFYDRFAWLQDWQAFYESPALERMVRDGDFGVAHAVVELGCGTGRLAERLLAHGLPADATYLGLDVSPRMVERTRQRLSRFGARAEVRSTGGSIRLPLPDSSRDRFVAAYVLDLLSEDDARLAVDEARRVLVPGGRLCAASLSSGTTRASRALCRVWSAVHERSPLLVGGCRPVDLRRLLAPERWEVSTCRTLVAFAVPTQVVVATARKLPG
jgi:ubiquinone/menaquinone biosynthesis C-methylase UbiE